MLGAFWAPFWAEKRSWSKKDTRELPPKGTPKYIKKTIKFISSLKQASYTNQVWTDLRLTVGQSYGELGEYKKAITIFENNFDKLKKNKNIYYIKAGNELALLYLKVGNFKKSVENDIDILLDKINRNGFDSLSPDEEKQLYENSKIVSRSKKKD